MNQNPHETATLKEILRIYTETEAIIKRYNQPKLIVSSVALGLTLLSTIGGSAGFLPAREAVISALFGGIAAGISFLYYSSLQQIPILLKYTTLDEKELESKIQAIETASSRIGTKSQGIS